MWKNRSSGKKTVKIAKVQCNKKENKEGCAFCGLAGIDCGAFVTNHNHCCV